MELADCVLHTCYTGVVCFAEMELADCMLHTCYAGVECFALAVRDCLPKREGRGAPEEGSGERWESDALAEYLEDDVEEEPDHDRHH